MDVTDGSSSGKSLRVFCAVELPEEIRVAAAEHAARLRREFPNVKASWARPEGLHVTLKFLGETPAARISELSRAASEAVVGFASFEMRVESAGVFPPRGPARVLWLGIHDHTGRLSQLQSRLEEKCAAADFQKETRPFKPHLTIARLRPGGDTRAISQSHRAAAFGPHRFNVSELLVIRSQLGPGGSRYTPISRHPFVG